MRRLIGLILLAILVQGFYASAQAQVEMLAQVDRVTVATGERFTYTLTVSGGMNVDITQPDFGELQIVYGPSRSSSVQIINGSVSSTTTLQWGLRSMTSGKITIPPATGKYKKKEYQSGSVTVEVGQGGNRAPSTGTSKGSEDSAPTSMNRLPDVFLRVHVNKDTVALREIVILTYKLYLSVQVNGYNIVKLPQASGFWQEEFPQGNRPVLEDVTVQGKAYKSAVIRKVALFPTRPGKLTVEPLVADVVVVIPQQRGRQQRSNDPFDNFFSDPFFGRSSQENRTVQTDPVNIVVNDLPDYGKPEGFTGDVGDLDMRVTYDKKEIEQNDALTMVVTISGSGYLKGINAPRIQLPSGFEQFAPTIEEKIAPTGNQVTGEKKFTYLIIPRRSGDFTLEPLKFSFYDPSAKQYKEKSGGGLQLTVTPSSRQVDYSQAGGPAEIRLVDQDIRFVKEQMQPLQRVQVPFYSSAWFYSSVGAFPAVYLLGLLFQVWWDRYNSDPRAVRRRKAPERMREALATAQKLAKNGELKRAIDVAGLGLAELIGALVDVSAASLTTEQIVEKLGETANDPELIRAITSINSETDMYRFTSIALDNEQTAILLDRYEKIANQLEKLV